MSAFGLHSGSGTQDFVRALDSMVQENELLKSRIAELEAKVGVKKKGWEDWTELKSFQKLDKFDGIAKSFSDWEFTLHRFMRPFKFAEKWMNWIKEQEVVITNVVASEKAREVQLLHPDVDLEEYDEQVYGLLSLLTTGTSLQIVKNQKEYLGIREALAWWKMTGEVAGKIGVRLERLADQVHNPKQFTYADAMKSLED